MDQAIRNKLRSVVTQCRRLLEESIAQQLQGRFDIYATGKKDEVKAEDAVPLGHLSDEERQARQDILAHFKHIDSQVHKPKESLEQLIREIAFTHLNRLCAYKMMEVRDVYVGGQRFREAVSKGLKSQGFLFYLADHPDDEKRYNAGEQEQAYRHFLNWLGDTLSQEIGILFSPTDPANRVYPPQRVLDEVLDLLNHEELKGIWSEDETIGWVYQYFTPKELRDQARKESQAPRNSYELAFRNQFFTPRYVVEFLTDNTLGRIWYEMRKGHTRLKEECRYMVRRPTEVYLRDPDRPLATPPRAEWVKSAARGDFSQMPDEPTIDDLSDFSLIHDGYELAERLGLGDCIEWADQQLEAFRQGQGLPKSSVELWLLLFRHQRYWGRSDGRGPSNVREWRSVYRDMKAVLTDRGETRTQEELLRRTVYILHRPKKDPRDIRILDPACGSGHFLLYCFALLLVIYEEAYDDPDLGPVLQAEYPTPDDLRKALPALILRHNLHGIDIDLRCTQIAALALWLRCQRAYQEMGFKKDRPRITKSNIVCAEPMPGERHMLQEFVSQIEPRLFGQLVEVVFEKMKLAGEVGSLLKIEEEIRDAVAEARRQWRMGPIATQLTLFAEQKPADRQQRFDLSGITDDQFFEQAEAKVVEALRNYAEKAQQGQRLQRRLFTEDAVRGFAFVDLCHKRFDVVLMNPPFGLGMKDNFGLMKSFYPDGYVDLLYAFTCRSLEFCSGMAGAITSRSILITKKLERLRSRSLLPRITALLDLGSGVMDGATVLSCAYTYSSMVTHDRRFVALDWTQAECRSETICIGQSFETPCYLPDRRSLDLLPRSQMLYSLPPRIISLLQSQDRLKPGVLEAKHGMNTFNNLRFLRLRWEIHPARIGEMLEWEPLSKGGPFALYYADLPLVVRWNGSGDEIAEENRRANGQTAQARQASTYYRRAGATYSRRSSKDFGVRMLPEGCIIGEKGPAVLATGQYSNEFIIALLNSRLMNALVHIQANFKQYDSGIIERLPWIAPPAGVVSELELLTRKCIRAVQKLASCSETNSGFAGICFSSSLAGTVAPWRRQVDDTRELVGNCQSRISDLVDDVYSIDSHELRDIVLGKSGGENGESESEPDDDDGDGDDDEGGISNLPSTSTGVAQVAMSVAFGCVVGRWDVRWFSDGLKYEQPPLFSPIPHVPPASIPVGGLMETAQDFCPLAMDGDGIVVDDAEHEDDAVRRIRDVVEIIWKERAEAIEKEACEIFEVKELREYFRKPGKGGFWDDHVSLYTKSRRKAPIYWLLQSSKKNYALWIYYHRLDKDILFKALLNYVEPKIRREESRLDELRSQKTALGPAAKGSKKIDKDIDRQESFLTELRDFEEKLRRAANLHFDPDLTDGVVLNIAPLRELVPWKEAKSYWDDLMDGQYEWSSIGKQLRAKGLVQ